jgi:hypothetical protein
MRLLLLLYPRPWRERYGEELAMLTADGGGLRPTVVVDVLLGAGRERLREGALLVLQAWALFVVGGVGVQKFSEHWREATPAPARAVPAGAFDGLVAGAAIGSALVLLGVAVALPAAVRARAFARREIVRALVATVVAGAALAAAAGRHGEHGLTIVFAVTFVLALAAWTSAVLATARRLDRLGLESALAVGVAASMVAMTICTCVWWGALARTGADFAPPLSPQLLASVALMALGSATGLAGAVKARRAPR